MSEVILPGAALGVLGGGQLGRMFAIAARRMGYRVHVLAPDDDTPTGQVADVEIKAAYDDLDAVARFARNIAALTFEFENVPAQAAETASRYTRVRPAGQVLHTTQNRLREKNFLRNSGLPVTPFAPVRSDEELYQGLQTLACPAVLKTAAWGYDGKGQVRIQTPEEATTAWAALKRQESVLEAFIDFECEVSVVAARGADGQFVHYGPLLNVHKNHILDVTVVPAGLPGKVEAEAVEIAREVLEKLEVVGVLCVEFFLTRDGGLLINELAPRPHNSGHLTINAYPSCQFEQQVRAVCGLPLGSTELLRPAAMANLLGDLWQAGTPNWAAALQHPGVSLHLYGKDKALPGRKMGHLTALGDTPETSRAQALAARQSLTAGYQ